MEKLNDSFSLGVHRLICTFTNILSMLHNIVFFRFYSMKFRQISSLITLTYNEYTAKILDVISV